jgi:hypothetical protein
MKTFPIFCSQAIFSDKDRRDMTDAVHKIGELALTVGIVARHTDPLGMARAHEAWKRRNDEQLSLDDQREAYRRMYDPKDYLTNPDALP